MYPDMDWWTKIRLEVLREEQSKREILRHEGIHWETLKKILTHSEPPGYRLKEPRPKPKIGPYLERIAQIIEQDKSLPKKQRHTAKRTYERIREMGYGGKYTHLVPAAFPAYDCSILNVIDCRHVIPISLTIKCLSAAIVFRTTIDIASDREN